MTFATFIIPSLGRPSLQDTMASLHEQIDGDWECIVEPGAKLGSAGATRNAALERRKHPGEWYCFLDDDDTVSSTYVSDLRHSAKSNPDADCIIFQMDDPYYGVLPPAGATVGELRRGMVGISFAVRQDFWHTHNLRFSIEDRSDPDPANWTHEDIDMIDQLRALDANIVIVPNVNYFVRPE
jgi:glycosyltransferase involved in cell wall biosynthesis